MMLVLQQDWNPRTLTLQGVTDNSVDRLAPLGLLPHDRLCYLLRYLLLHLRYAS